MDKEALLKKKKEMERKRQLSEANFHRLSGAIAFIDEQISELDKEVTDGVPT